MSSKTNLRSFRYSDEVAGILEAFGGGSLNEKFENLILHCFWERKKVDELLTQKRKEHDRLCEQLKTKREQLLELDTLLADKKRISSAIAKLTTEIWGYTDRVAKQCNTISDARPGAGADICVTPP